MLVAFDFDGTLTADEMTVRLAERQGVADEMASITERAMAGELSYAESLRRRARLLSGLAATEAEEAYRGVRLRPGAGALLSDLRDAGLTVVILTGGFRPGVEAALEAADTTVDTIISNELPTADGKLTGDVVGPLIEGTKDEALADRCAEANVDLSDTVAVGDGANDRPMLEVAGLAVGFEPKPTVAPACDVIVESVDELRAVFEDRGLLPAT
ncbi:MAG: phosphoserine phosphatase SerB [Halodesulfurarchaeum sp.]